MQNNDVTIIRIRKGINGYKYSACDHNGNFFRNLEKLSDARRRWSKEIKWGRVVLVRELEQMPDMSVINDTKKLIDAALWSMSSQRKRKSARDKSV